MLELSGSETIEGIDQQHRQLLDLYLEQSGGEPRLDVSPAHMRYVFMPPRLLEVMGTEPNLDVYLVEGLDPELLTVWVGNYKKGKVDPLIDIQLKAYQTPHGAVLRLNHFVDDLRIRGSHVTSQVLGRVQEFASLLGFTGLNAFNNSSNIGFFRDHLGWPTVDQLQPALAAELVPDMCNLDPRYITFRFL